MARGAATSAHRDDQDPAQGNTKASKRRCVQSACVPCRKRKSKCDGGTPVCATCTAVYRTECFYDPESEGRRTKGSGSSVSAAGTKRDAALVASSSGNYSDAEFFVDTLRRLPEDHVHELISQIRRDPHADINALAESFRSTVSLPSNASLEEQSLESDLSVIVGRPGVTFHGESRQFGSSATLGLVAEDENFSGGRVRSNTVHIERQGTTWTNVTSDMMFVERLLNLYFTWSHPFYVLFSRECFYKDFRAGRDKYCSSLLVNAICAYACHLTDEPAGRTDPSNFRTAGDHFFSEARRLLFEDETPRLTTVQALCIMSMREPSTGRDSSGFGYSGRCVRMCVELGLHLNNSASPALQLTPSEIEVRKVTFWGCFTVDSVYSLAVGRISQLPRAAITLDKPILDEPATMPESFPGTPHTPAGIVTTRLFLQEFTTLSELVNDNNFMFYGPKERLTSARLLDCYNKYQAWYRRLPHALTIEAKKSPEPHVLVLHMLYHTTIVHLFRPFLKVDLIRSEVRPRDICMEAANKASSIVQIYRQWYDFRTAHLIIPHILLTISVVHLLYSKDNRVSYQNLVDGLQDLEDIHECHYFGARSFRIIHTLAKTWNLPFPIELSNSQLIPTPNTEKPPGTVSSPADPLMVPLNTMATGGHMSSDMSYPPMGNPNRRESLSMFGAQSGLQIATHAATTRPGSVPANQRIQSPTVGHTPTTYNASVPLYGNAYPPPAISTMATAVSSTITSPTTDAAETLFWNPIPGMPGPILPRSSYHMSSMNLDSVLGGNEMGDRLGRDGFKINEDWQSSHVSGFVPRPITNYSQQRATQQPSATYVHPNPTSYAQGQSSENAGYQQHQQRSAHQQQHQSSEGYDGSWYSGQMS